MEPRGGSTQPTRRRKRGDPLTPAQAVEAVRARVAANASERLSLKWRTLDGPAAVRAACDAISRSTLTVTLNLTGAEVCSGGADALAGASCERCAVEELCLVDRPRLGVHMADTGVAADIPDRERTRQSPTAGNGPLARALAKNTTRLGAQPRVAASTTEPRSARGGPRREGRVAVSQVLNLRSTASRPRRRPLASLHPRRVPSRRSRWRITRRCLPPRSRRSRGACESTDARIWYARRWACIETAVVAVRR